MNRSYKNIIMVALCLVFSSFSFIQSQTKQDTLTCYNVINADDEDDNDDEDMQCPRCWNEGISFLYLTSYIYQGHIIAIKQSV